MYWNLLTTTIDINTRSVTTGATGNSYAYTTAYGSVPASVQPVSDSLSLNDDGRKVMVDYNVFVSQAVAVNPGDQVVWDGIVMKINYVKNLIGLGSVYMIHATQFIDGA